MQIVKYCLVILIIGITIISCKKTDGLIPVSSLRVVNATSSLANAKVKTPNATGYYSLLNGVNFGGNAVFTLPAGTAQITIASVLDTTKPIYNDAIATNAGDLYSLFIAGTEVVLHKDIIPYYTDSVFGVRFINLSNAAGAVNVTLTTSASTNEFSGIAYKSITDFKTYGAGSTDPVTYTFQVTDGSGIVLATSAGLPRATLVQHNTTVVLTDVVNAGVTSQILFTANNY